VYYRVIVKPLNGEKAHPLSQTALDALRQIARKAVSRGSVNPGVALIDVVDLPSPFKTREGNAPHYVITDTGRERAR
jgi:hypothetical protein